jgi:hypothetical protein
LGTTSGKRDNCAQGVAGPSRGTRPRGPRARALRWQPLGQDPDAPAQVGLVT